MQEGGRKNARKYRGNTRKFRSDNGKIVDIQ